MKINWSQTTVVFGGTFDPPHAGHTEAVKDILQILSPKKLIVMVSGQPALKTSMTSARHRLAMCKIAMSEIKDDRIEVSDFEVVKSEQGSGTSYTHNTVQELKRDYPLLAIAIGTDQFLQFRKWHRYQELLETAHWLLIARKPGGLDKAFEEVRTWNLDSLSKGDFLTPAKSKLFKILDTNAPEISSTQTRATVAKTGKFPEKIISHSVITYCHLNGLYGIPPSP